MPAITKRGRELAKLVEPFVGGSKRVREICSLIARQAATHARLSADDCNVGMTPRQRRQEGHVEARIRKLVATLPRPRGRAAIGVEFSGDPRGFTVKLVVPGDKGGNTWGLDGRYGV